MNIPSHVWVVVDKNGNVTVRKTFEHAQAIAAAWDFEYPSLAPHQVICYSVSVPLLPNIRDDTGLPDALPDPTFTAEAP